jgi:hypothetical protein
MANSQDKINVYNLAGMFALDFAFFPIRPYRSQTGCLLTCLDLKNNSDDCHSKLPKQPWIPPVPSAD